MARPFSVARQGNSESKNNESPGSVAEQGRSTSYSFFSLTGTKKGLQSHLTLKTLIKEGSYLLSHIALQYHRRKRA